MKQWVAVILCSILGLPVWSESIAESAESSIAPAVEIVETAPGEVTEPVESPAEETAPAVTQESVDIPGTQEPADAAVEAPKPPRFVVILPERIDHDWYWFLYTDTAQHIVQSQVEKALVRAGVEVVDVATSTMPAIGSDMQKLLSMAYALEAGKTLAVDYVITGQATAVKASEGFAYGVNVYRSQAEITAKIVRVSDGKILALEDASIQEGGQSAQAAGQAALKKAGGQVASKIARIARGLVDAAPATR